MAPVSGTTWDGETWCLRRRGFDLDALANDGQTQHSSSTQGMVDAHVDWETCRDTWPNVEETHQGTPRAQARLERRRTRPGMELRHLCAECELPPPERRGTLQDMLAKRPGAVNPFESCEGCMHSYVGELDEDDRSLLAAYGKRPEIERHRAAYRARQVVARERARRKRLVEAGLKAAQARRRGVA